MIEVEVPFRVWAARQTVRMHCEPPAPALELPHDRLHGAAAARATGRCAACPDSDDEVCEAFRCAIRRLLDYGGIPYLYRFGA